MTSGPAFPLRFGVILRPYVESWHGAGSGGTSSGASFRAAFLPLPLPLLSCWVGLMGLGIPLFGLGELSGDLGLFGVDFGESSDSNGVSETLLASSRALLMAANFALQVVKVLSVFLATFFLTSSALSLSIWLFASSSSFLAMSRSHLSLSILF